MNFKWLLLGMILISSGQLWGQEEPVDTTKEDNRIIVDLADFAEYLVDDDGIVTQKLMKDIRQVELRQGNTFMYCDTAIIIANNVTAFGNVIIQQGDSINVFADSLVYDSNTSIADLFGKVVLHKNDQQLFTERLRYTLDEKKAVYHQGALLTNGGAQLTSKHGIFYVDKDLAFFSQEVVIVDTSFTLQSDTLEYDTNLEIATFHGPTLIQQEKGAKIYCEAGFYDIPSKLAEFSKNAQYVKEDQVATADIMNYDGSLKEVFLRGNAQFTEPGKEASADVIRYDEANDITYLEGNAKFRDQDKFAEADSIEYDAKNEAFATIGRSNIVEGNQTLEADQVDFDSETGFGFAEGNVIWIDTAEQTTIYAEEAKYNKETEYIKSYGDRPMMISVMDEDSFYMAADTLLSYKVQTEVKTVTDSSTTTEAANDGVDSLALNNGEVSSEIVDGVEKDSVRYFEAYHDVRFLKSDLQGKCDSLFFDGQDSVFQLIGNPIIWSDSTQFTADSIWIYLDSNTIKKILFKQNALIVNTKDELFFNQIQGREMTAYFVDGSIKTMDVNGNAESIYYAQDSSLAYIAVNKGLSSKMKLTFDEGDLSNIHYIKDPVSNVYPMRKADHEGMKLKGFSWQWSRRPTSPESLRKPITKKVKPANPKEPTTDLEPSSDSNSELKENENPNSQ